jgi:hypothetical protein
MMADAKRWFKDEAFDISTLAFSQYSRRFARELLLHGNVHEYVTSDDVTLPTFSELVSPCQVRPHHVVKAMIHELQFLCEQWAVPAILSEIFNHLSALSNPKSLVIQGIVPRYRRNRDGSAVEEQLLSLSFSDYLPEPEIASLTLSILARLVPADIPTEHVGAFARPIESCLDTQGGTSSILLRLRDIGLI